MRPKLKHLSIRNIFRRFKKQRPCLKRDEEGIQTDNELISKAAVTETAEVEPELELSPLSIPGDHDAGPTTVPSTTIITSHKLENYPPGHPAASSQISVPQITVVDPDGNRTSPRALRIHEATTSARSELLNAPDAIQEGVGLALARALYSDGHFSGLVGQILAALVPVLDERIKLALDANASSTESKSSIGQGTLLRDPAILEAGPRLINIGGYPVEIGAGTYPTGYARAPSDVEIRSSGATAIRTDTPPASPVFEHRNEPFFAPRTLYDFLGREEYSLEWIGGGVSGQVYRATGNSIRTPRVRFALKFVPLYSEDSRKAAVLEARALLKIKAASIYSEGARHVLRADSAPEALITCHAVIKTPYYKNTLHDYAKILSRGSLLFVTAEVIKGLQFLHSIQIVHLDLKPENIFIDDEGHCVIGDFSGSHIGPLPKLAADQWSTMTPEYMAPEISIARTSSKSDERADIWCLGVTIYLLICGSRAVKMLRGEEFPGFTDYDNIGLDKDTMIRSMNLVGCSGTVQKLVLEMCQMDQNLRWNTTMIQRYLEERNYWKWDGDSPLLRYSVRPVSPRSDRLGHGLAAPEGILPDALRACREMYMKEVYTITP